MGGDGRGTLLAAKTRLPRAPSTLVARDRLLAALDRGDAPVTTVVAGAGYGKTTLVAHWAAGCGLPVAWVSLDAGDDDPRRFWSYVAAGLSAVSPDAAARADRALAVAGSNPLEDAVPQLLNGIGDGPGVLVLDDLHAVTSGEVHEGLELFLDYLPPGLRVVLVSRSAPPLALPRLRARGLLRELAADELRLTPREQRALLDAVLGPGAAQVPADVLEEADGWAAGVVLAALAAGSPRPVEHARARGREQMADYLIAEVLEGLPPGQRGFLLVTAVLPVLEPALCDAALGAEGSADVLRALERAGAFVAQDGAAYSCHPVFRRGLLRQAYPGRQEAARRAASALAARGEPEPAVRLLLDAGDSGAAVALLLGQAATFLASGALGSFVSLGEAVGEARLRTSPALATLLAWAAGQSGRRQDVHRFLAVADAAEAAFDLPGFRCGRSVVAALRSVHAGPGDLPDVAEAYARQAVAQEDDPALPGFVVAHVALGGALLCAGHVDAAVDALQAAWRAPATAALPAPSRTETAGLLAWALCRAHAWDELARLVAATAHEARRLRDELGAAAGPSLALLDASAGLLARHRGDAAGALAALRTAASELTAASHPGIAALVLVAAAHEELACASPSGALARLDAARAALDEAPAMPFLEEEATMLEQRAGRVQAGGTAAQLVEPLTARELSVLRALRGPLAQPALAAELGLSINTVKGYAKALYRKLGVGSRAEAVARGRELGLW
ncbi:LuxR C-terminal-related transcriptional regulator [Motilibacter deserti]|uniref:LuxR family transcriptional regulator n=1 Tax=Motilibacter deserti TaxID=2714956 RepID=A0ABX0GV18_9ACTN|nr:LuxR C-terminal-related transcriptional regulator [Motilibacter deserti]NHC13502.1 LuxR family transcriptional regulator [Motilibacter deserti]